MDILAACREVGSYRAAAAICGTMHKMVRRVVEAHEAGCAGQSRPGRKDRGHNYESVRGLVTERVAKSSARISAKRLLPAARAAGYEGSARNFRRLVAEVKTAWRAGHHRGRRRAVWTPGDTLVIDWGADRGLHVFCAVLAWSRVRFVRFAADEKAATTLGLLAFIGRGIATGVRLAATRDTAQNDLKQYPEPETVTQVLGIDLRSFSFSLDSLSGRQLVGTRSK
jgi:transposase